MVGVRDSDGTMPDAEDHVSGLERSSPLDDECRGASRPLWTPVRLRECHMKRRVGLSLLISMAEVVFAPTICLGGLQVATMDGLGHC